MVGVPIFIGRTTFCVSLYENYKKMAGATGLPVNFVERDDLLRVLKLISQCIFYFFVF